MLNSKLTRASECAGKLTAICIILPLILLVSGLANAGDSNVHQGVIDAAPQGATTLSQKQIKKLVKKEQRKLAKLNRKEQRSLAKKGERLAQVSLGNDFASEAQLLTFAPVAANAALSDAISWYSLAAKRGFPGAPSLDASGVSFYPVRVVRNR